MLQTGERANTKAPEEGPCLECSRNSKEASLAAVGKWGQLKEVTFCKATVRFLDFILREMGRQGRVLSRDMKESTLISKKTIIATVLENTVV